MQIWLISVLVLAGAIFAADGCGKTSYPPSSWRVVGGTKATHGTWPWQISLRMLSGGTHRHICGGTIINDQWILTAAHCFLATSSISGSREAAYYRVRVGEHKQTAYDGTERDHYVEKIIRHYSYYGYQPTDPHDIALIKLSSKISFNTHVQPVCLNQQYGQFDSTDGCWITGWGDTKGTEDSNYLQQLSGRVWSNRECQYGWDRYSGWQSSIQSGMVCFGHGSTGACVGDSGGPLVCKKPGTSEYVQIGVTSWGHGDCDKYGKPSVYTRVSSYHSWITNTVSYN
ncbi:chymotrypsin-like elastase family member 1 [Lineus longissimus]|uniref:chymotrypsin-like elastase family member 1 n=1 Tax=Lineus longissimus TaxID=88925 RepID=UPI002B4DEA7F